MRTLERYSPRPTRDQQGWAINRGDSHGNRYLYFAHISGVVARNLLAVDLHRFGYKAR